MRHLQRTNGLAMSSRNERLKSKRERRIFNFKTLNLAKEKFKTNSATDVTKWVENHSKKTLL
jgi:pantoate--beta-alanine ligase